MNTIITAAILGSFVTLTVNVAAIAQSITATPGTFEITPDADSKVIVEPIHGMVHREKINARDEGFGVALQLTYEPEGARPQQGRKD
jgi:hypothetical protein